MPDKKTADETTGVKQGFGLTVQDRLNELQGKLHLEECDRKVVFAWMENERKVNEATIIKLRQETKQKHRALADSINADEDVIKKAFSKKRTEQLSLKRLTADQAVVATDQKACERVKVLNNLRQNRQVREQKLRDMALELKQMRLDETENAEARASAQRVRGLENSLDKARMKFETAKNIGDQYEQIVKKMREESMTFPARLDTMEAAVKEVHQERKNLEKMRSQAQNSRDASRAHLARMERDLINDRKERDGKLNTMRKEVEGRRQDLGKTDKSSKKSTNPFNDSQQDRAALLQAKLKSENQLKLMTYDALFTEIKHATGLTKLSDFVARFENQNDTQERLLARSSEYQQLNTKLSREKEKLQRKMQELKYSGEKRFSVGQSTLENTADGLDVSKDSSARTKELMNEKGQLLVQIKTGLKTIFEKLIDVKLPPPAHNRLSGDVEIDIGIICEKYDRLLKSLGATDSLKILDLPDLHEVLEGQLGDDNIRVQLKKSSSYIESEFEYELHDTEEVPTRDDIKQKGLQIIDSKLKPKKKGKA